MNEENPENFKNTGERIKYVRRNLLHMSREFFSKKYHLSAGTLQGWESNRYKKLSEDTIDMILQAFDTEGLYCSKEWLLSGEGKAPQNKQKADIFNKKFVFPSRINEEEKEAILEQTLKYQKMHILNQKLLTACKNGSASLVEELIDQGANAHLLTGEELHFYGNEQNSPLHIAAQNNHLEVIKVLLERNCQIDARNRRDETPLHWACHSSDINVIQFMVNKGAGINAVEHEGGTPFAWACYIGREKEIIEFLYENGADINLTEMRNNTPLYWACNKGHYHVVKFLIEKKVVFKLNNKGDSILDIAIKNGQIETVKLLLHYMKIS